MTLLNPYLGCEVHSFGAVSLLEIWLQLYDIVAVFAIFIHAFIHAFIHSFSVPLVPELRVSCSLSQRSLGESRVTPWMNHPFMAGPHRTSFTLAFTPTDNLESN